MLVYWVCGESTRNLHDQLDRKSDKEKQWMPFTLRNLPGNYQVPVLHSIATTAWKLPLESAHDKLLLFGGAVQFNPGHHNTVHYAQLRAARCYT